MQFYILEENAIEKGWHLSILSSKRKSLAFFISTAKKDHFTEFMHIVQHIWSTIFFIETVFHKIVFWLTNLLHLKKVYTVIIFPFQKLLKAKQFHSSTIHFTCRVYSIIYTVYKQLNIFHTTCFEPKVMFVN